MAFRLYVGGLPAAVTHGDLEQWAWTVTNVFPVAKQLVRKDHQETLVSSFLGYTTESDMLQSLQLLKRNPWFHGYKTSVSFSKDSKKTTTPAATQAPPVLPAPPAVRTMVSQGAQCEATTMVSKAVATEVTMGTQEVQTEATEVTMVTQEVQTELSGPCISNEAIKTEPLACPHCGKKIKVQVSSPSPKTLSPATPMPYSPTEAAYSPTVSPVPDTEPPTVLLDQEKTKEELEGELAQAKAELLEIKKELDK